MQQQKDIKMKTKKNNPLNPLRVTLDVTLEELRGSCRQRRISDARALLSALLNQYYHLTQNDIAQLLHTQQCSVSKMQQRHRNLLAIDPAYRKKWEKLKNKITENQAA